MCQQLTEYLNVNNLFPKWQSAYRQYHSTETALVRLANDLLLSVDQGKMTILVSLDQSAAFDVCDIVILTERLRYSYGINGTALKLLTSYLSNRSVRVKVGNSDLSEFCETKYGVPQGSTLGPLLYILYTGPLINFLATKGIGCQCYADDLQLYFVFEAFTPNVVFNIEQCLKEIQLWMQINFLKLNPDKTEMFLIGSKNNSFIKNKSTITVNIDGDNVENIHCMKSLGVLFDNVLSMESFVSSKCKCMGLYLTRMSKVRKFL